MLLLAKKLCGASSDEDDDDQAIEQARGGDLTTALVSPFVEKDGNFKPSSAEAEKMIRDIVSCSIDECSEAKNIAIGIMGLCRTLNTMATMALEDSDNKHLCSEAAGTIAVASTCERMIRSITGFYLIENYVFHDGSEED